MTLKILTPAEIKQAKDSELKRDNLRIETTREALSKLQTELNDTEAKFEVALSNQHVRWANEEKEATKRLDDIRKEIEIAEKHRESIVVPIDDDRKKAHDLLIEAEAAFKEAKHKDLEAYKKFQDYEEKLNALQTRLDSVSERDQDLNLREQKVVVQELAVKEERRGIKNLARELSIKLSKL